MIGQARSTRGFIAAGDLHRLEKMEYLLDTSAINGILDRKINVGQLPGDSKFFITHLQIDEINNTADSDRRARLSIMLSEIRPVLIPTETLVCDFSRCGHAKLGNGKKYEDILARLGTPRKTRENNIRDALIAETAHANGYCLLTADMALAKAAEECGCIVRRIDC